MEESTRCGLSIPLRPPQKIQKPDAIYDAIRQTILADFLPGSLLQVAIVPLRVRLLQSLTYGHFMVGIGVRAHAVLRGLWSVLHRFYISPL